MCRCSYNFWSNNLKFFNHLDLILYSKSPNCFENSLNYVKSFLKKNKFIKMRDFFEIEEKSFEADLFAEEEVIKIPKKYELITSNKKSYSAKNFCIANAYKKEKVGSEYFVIKKVY